MMIKVVYSCFLLCLCLYCPAQQDTDKITDSIVNEGKRLYRSEMASWYGTDIFLEKFKEDRSNLGGYFSYQKEDITNCVFYTKGDQPKILVTISFDDTYDVSTAKVDPTRRDLTAGENAIYQLRKQALEIINNDTLFKVYQNTNLNIIPLVDKDERKVYVLTGPKVSGVVIFGNDYLLRFDKDNKLVSKRTLHKNIISMNYGAKDGGEVVGTMHSHLPETGDFISATDICTLMLYAKFAKWKQHIVMSANFISIWDCEKDQLVALTKEAWDRISADQEKRKAEKKDN